MIGGENSFINDQEIEGLLAGSNEFVARIIHTVVSSNNHTQQNRWKVCIFRDHDFNNSLFDLRKNDLFEKIIFLQ